MYFMLNLLTNLTYPAQLWDSDPKEFIMQTNEDKPILS